MNGGHDFAASESFLSLLDQSRQYADEYIEGLSTRPVYPSTDSIRRLEELGGTLPETSSDPHDVLKKLHQTGAAGAVAQTSGRYFGFVNGGVLPVGLAARWLADTWDQNTAHYVMSPVNAHLEAICENWLVDLFQFPEGTAAGFVTGTTLANFSGLCAGRNELLRRRGWNVATQGLYGAPRLRLIVGAGAHAAIYKSVSMLGLGTDNIEIVPSDSQGRLRPDRLPDLDESALVVAQAGNVNSGAIDPVGEICERVAASQSWVHVDGAFGLWARVLPRLDDVCRGLEKADSWSVDAHKTLNVPYDSGVILCRDRVALNEAFRASASYFQWSDHRDGMNYTPSMSKRARIIELWAVLKSLGRQGVQRLVDQLCDNARLFAEKLESHGFQRHNEVIFNQVLVSCGGDDRLTQGTIQEIQRSGECWCGGSSWDGKTVIRISVCDWATTEIEIDRSVAAFVAARAAADRELSHVEE